MNQEKELLRKVKEQYAEETGKVNVPNPIAYSREDSDNVAFRYAKELLKLRLGELRKEMRFRPRMKEYDRGKYCPDRHVSDLVNWAEDIEIAFDKTLKELDQ